MSTKPGLYDPIIPPPPGETANLKDPYSLRGYDALTQTICLAITTILISIRLYTKARILRSVGWDDWTSLAAWVGLIVYGAILFRGDHYGSGRHMWNVTVHDFIYYAVWANVSQFFYPIVILTSKVSILLLYLRVFAPARMTWLLIHAVLWVNVIAYLAGFFAEIFQCRPREKIWKPWIQGKCLNQWGLQLASGIFNTASDLILIILPIGTVKNLVLKKSTKIGLMMIFGTASLFVHNTV
ncbi:MAG: hypothetical protein Q9220_007490 [cf. Caloplaca sp. 1 TL-2023]